MYVYVICSLSWYLRAFATSFSFLLDELPKSVHSLCKINTSPTRQVAEKEKHQIMEIHCIYR